MSGLLLTVGRWFSRRHLSIQILSLVFGATLLSATIIGTLSFQARMKQVQEEALEQGSALSSMVARATASLMLERDYGSLELFLGELMTLPGVRQAELVHPGGEVAMSTRRTANGHTTRFPASERSDPPPLRQWQEGLQIHTVIPLVYSPGPESIHLDRDILLRNGWVHIETDSSLRRADAMRQWMIDGLNVMLMLLGLLWLLALFLRRVFGPIGALAAFASTLVDRPGDQVRMRWGSLEVRELGRALNATSDRLAQLVTELEQRYRRQRAILDTAADAIIGLDANGRVVSSNPAAERMFGFTEEELRTRPMADLMPEVDAARLPQCMAEGMVYQSTGSRVGRIETDAMRHGGTPFPVEVLIGEIPDDPEVRYTCIVRDLTDMKLVEEYLTLYGRVLDCSPVGVSVSNARRYPQPIVHVNPAYARITGYAAHELLGRDASILEGPLTDPDDLALLERTLKTGGELKVTLRNYRKDGSVFYNKLSVSPVRDVKGEITHYINVIEDVSAQVEVKQRLIERTSRLNATFDLSPDGFVVFDNKGDLVTSNPAMQSMIGEAGAWMPMGSFDHWMQSLCENPEAYTPIDQVGPHQAQQTLVLARPRRKVLEREVRKQLSGSGETFVYFRDVTRQYEVDQMKSEFLATAAHELRTPLASILGFTELMIHRKYSEEKQKDLLQTVHRQGTLLNNLIQELLDLSRIEARQGKDFRIEPHRLDDIVKAAVTTFTHDDAGRQVQVDHLPALTVMADASKIEQALTNLLSNAFKYSPQGGDVRLSVEQAHREGIPCAVIHVKDHGIGMTPEQLDRAFERFYRADTSGNIPGTGLGLNLVKEIAEIHGGTVELTSEPGVGTVAHLWLKLATATEPAEAQPTA